jgi:hypothetical protein
MLMGYSDRGIVYRKFGSKTLSFYDGFLCACCKRCNRTSHETVRPKLALLESARFSPRIPTPLDNGSVKAKAFDLYQTYLILESQNNQNLLPRV